jgi:hypothetical protein
VPRFAPIDPTVGIALGAVAMHGLSPGRMEALSGGQPGWFTRHLSQAINGRGVHDQLFPRPRRLASSDGAAPFGKGTSSAVRHSQVNVRTPIQDGCLGVSSLRMGRSAGSGVLAQPAGVGPSRYRCHPERSEGSRRNA